MWTAGMNNPRPLKRFAVSLGPTRVGTLFQKGDWTSFELNETYVADRRHPILGLRFEERQTKPYSSSLRLPPWFSNLLPESPMREWIASGRGVSIDREMEILAQVGSDLPGAVTVQEEVATAADDKRRIDDESAPPAPLWDFSLAGVALKFSMLQRGDRLTLSTRTEGGQWILKTPDPKFRNVPLNEYAMMRLASLCGINTPQTRLITRDEVESLPNGVWHQDENRAFLVERFDRRPDGSRIHVEDFLQILDRYPETKYLGSFENVAALAYRARDVDALVEFARRLTLNVLIGNGDAHYKNWSLIYNDPEMPTLSPVYDIVATSAYFAPGAEDLGLKLAKDRRIEHARIWHLGMIASRLGVEQGLLMDASREVISRAAESWAAIADLLSEDVALMESIRESITVRSASFLSSGA